MDPTNMHEGRVLSLDEMIAQLPPWDYNPLLDGFAAPVPTVQQSAWLDGGRDSPLAQMVPPPFTVRSTASTFVVGTEPARRTTRVAPPPPPPSALQQASSSHRTTQLMSGPGARLHAQAGPTARAGPPPPPPRPAATTPQLAAAHGSREQLRLLVPDYSMPSQSQQPAAAPPSRRHRHLLSTGPPSPQAGPRPSAPRQHPPAAHWQGQLIPPFVVPSEQSAPALSQFPPQLPWTMQRPPSRSQSSTPFSPLWAVSPSPNLSTPATTPGEVGPSRMGTQSPAFPWFGEGVARVATPRLPEAVHQQRAVNAHVVQTGEKGDVEPARRNSKRRLSVSEMDVSASGPSKRPAIDASVQTRSMVGRQVQSDNKILPSRNTPVTQEPDTTSTPAGPTTISDADEANAEEPTVDDVDDTDSLFGGAEEDSLFGGSDDEEPPSDVPTAGTLCLPPGLPRVGSTTNSLRLPEVTVAPNASRRGPSAGVVPSSSKVQLSEHEAGAAAEAPSTQLCLPGMAASRSAASPVGSTATPATLKGAGRQVDTAAVSSSSGRASSKTTVSRNGHRGGPPPDRAPSTNRAGVVASGSSAPAAPPATNNGVADRPNKNRAVAGQEASTMAGSARAQGTSAAAAQQDVRQQGKSSSADQTEADDSLETRATKILNVNRALRAQIPELRPRFGWMTGATVASASTAPTPTPAPAAPAAPLPIPVPAISSTSVTSTAANPSATPRPPPERGPASERGESEKGKAYSTSGPAPTDKELWCKICWQARKAKTYWFNDKGLRDHTREQHPAEYLTGVWRHD